MIAMSTYLFRLQRLSAREMNGRVLKSEPSLLVGMVWFCGPSRRYFPRRKVDFTLSRYGETLRKRNPPTDPSGLSSRAELPFPFFFGSNRTLIGPWGRPRGRLFQRTISSASNYGLQTCILGVSKMCTLPPTCRSFRRDCIDLSSHLVIELVN